MRPSDRPNEDGSRSPHVSFLTRLLATGLFTGYIPWASGTFGSLLGCLCVFLPGFDIPALFLLIIAVGFACGVYCSAQVAAAEGHILSKSAAVAKAMFQPQEHTVPDPSIVVIDEVVGMWVSLFLLPHTIPVAAAAFVLFRVFDIVKPPPARQVESIPNGWGIMLDDVAAGIYANLGTRFLIYVLPILQP